MATENLTVALAGNPNSGKTTIFNNITGARQHVGNYPGVTVERREGLRRFDGKDLLLVDLPGTYSLTAHSLDELVARNVIINDKPDIIVNILDASNMERNLYLAVQLLELERPVVLALNMTDVAEKMGLKIDDALLSRKLGIAVVRTVGNRNRGTDDLLKTVVDAAAENERQPFTLYYGPEIEAKIEAVAGALAALTEIKYPLRWLAIKLLENDRDVNRAIGLMPGGEEIIAKVENARADLKAVFADDPELVIAERRYQFVGEVYREVAVSRQELSRTASDKIDDILTHRVFGLPIFFGVMWLLFNVVFTVGAYPQGWIEDSVAWLGEMAGQYMAGGDLKSLAVDGIIGGVGGVLVFLPNVILLFLGIALLEDTGYMARAAFVMDRVMRAVGLHGKSFIPLLVGFGCSVPAIMGTRTLENPRDRMVTILVAPLMSCSARLPVYTLLTAAFFSKEIAGTVLFSVYFVGIALAVGMAFVFRKLLFPGATEAFMMEMPPYHLPTLRSILTHMWERSVLYLKKAGTLILAASILVWFATNYPVDVKYSKDYEQAKAQVEEKFSVQAAAEALAPLKLEKPEDNAAFAALLGEITALHANHQAEDADKAAAEAAITAKLAQLEQTRSEIYPYALRYFELEQQKKGDTDKLNKEQAGEKLAGSYAGRLGKAIDPVIAPLGFDWKIGVGLISAMAAKEVLVSTLGTIYSVGEVEDDSSSLQEALAADPAFSPLVAYALMVFTLIYSPCLAALAVLRRETNSWKWTAFSFTYSTALAWVIALVIYQTGSMLGY
ncbi:ferrous iron transport protein B [Anaeroselena agilis]|uniref:Ferrous iron transport protein B n=1 Tax=Anaeroselena agilis TaxID=3063788 RepID=A0ABU3NU92_9FIRM|nr:ferrous iron transport protein B [Selenomonadales bacterium 4137-cl]